MFEIYWHMLLPVQVQDWDRNRVSRILHPCIWIEDESQRIGNLQIPMPLWHTMRKDPVFLGSTV